MKATINYFYFLKVKNYNSLLITTKIRLFINVRKKKYVDPKMLFHLY